ncbi:MAG: DNA-processing protein DprA [Candidatus Zixiibacteriota bacterium]
MHRSIDETAIQVLALCRLGKVNSRFFDRLVRQFTNIEDILWADIDTLQSISEIDAEQALQIASVRDRLDEARATYLSLIERDIEVISRMDERYPSRLIEIHNPPPLLFLRGKLPAPDPKLAAVVGTHRASERGIETTATLVRRLIAENVQVLSELTGGIAATAHLTTRTGGGESYAVLSCGFDRIDQTEGTPLAIDIASNGGLISEYAPELDATENSYSEANRIIAGMAQAVIITEVYQDSVEVFDMMECCEQLGKLAFLILDEHEEIATDDQSLAHAIKCGVIPIVGHVGINNMIKAIV